MQKNNPVHDSHWRLSGIQGGELHVSVMPSGSQPQFNVIQPYGWASRDWLLSEPARPR
ncbi:hypothetical protein [Pseudomonas putida]|uniref:hypothetical protein n=1 Tax=Pseudomonas putida TaxID=303 RepID=UPI0012DB4C01|nr:hypothetical protein [Pseudomonas putida]